MPYKNIFNITLIDNVSMATSVTSSSVDLSTVQGFSIHAFWTGSPAGSFYLEASDDDIHWAIYQDSTATLPVVGNSIFWNVSATHFDKVRIVFAHTSGTGNLTVLMNAKGDDNA